MSQSAYLQIVAGKSVIKLKAVSAGEAKEWFDGLIGLLRLKLRKAAVPVISFAAETGAPEIVSSAKDANEHRVGGDASGDASDPSTAEPTAGSSNDAWSGFKGGSGGLDKSNDNTGAAQGYISVKSSLPEAGTAAAAGGSGDAQVTEAVPPMPSFSPVSLSFLRSVSRRQCPSGT